MKKLSLLFSIAASALLLSAVPRASLAAETPRITLIVPYGYGVNIHETQFSPTEAQLVRAAGFGLVRMDFYWQNIESHPGSYDFKAYDAQLAQLRALGVRPLWILDFTNSNYDSNQPPHTPAGLQAFASFARAASAHYKNQGVVWEIWNEPNIAEFWSTGPSADQYAALVKATVPAIRAADPKAAILAGAVSGINLPYITQLLKDNAFYGVTALSVHPYRVNEPETVIPEYAALRALIARYTPGGQKAPQIVCSEWGYTTANEAVSEDEQARYITRMYLCNLVSGVDLTIDYDWKDDGPDPGNTEHRYGIVHQDLSPKPAYTAISALLNALKDYRYEHRIDTGSSTAYKLLFRGSKGLALVQWTSDPAASAASQTPTVTLVSPGSAGYTELLQGKPQP